jgi:hypothetical protein
MIAFPYVFAAFRKVIPLSIVARASYDTLLGWKFVARIGCLSSLSSLTISLLWRYLAGIAGFVIAILLITSRYILKGGIYLLIITILLTFLVSGWPVCPDATVPYLE